MKVLKTFFKFLSHIRRSRKWNSFHSPYLYGLFCYACDDTVIYPVFDRIEKIRSGLLKSQEKIQRTDLGAGSTSPQTLEMKISKIAGASLSNPFQCRFMARMTKWTGIKTIVELGTSLGISAAYLASGSAMGKIVTVEGDPALCLRAEEIFQELEIRHIDVIHQSFEEYIGSLKQSNFSIDLLFIDGNHRKEKLLEYYDGLKRFFHPDTIVIVDDIHWSKGMHESWNKLRLRSEITQSVDCFQFGLLFYHPRFLEKENHIIRLPLKPLIKS